jgi:CspA family cold shock protein
VALQRGKVKWFSDEKGFGFLEGQAGQDIFVHHTDIKMEGWKTLAEGQEVEYELTNSPKGLKASTVTPLPAA